MNNHTTRCESVTAGVMVNPVNPVNPVSPNYCIPIPECCTPVYDSLVDPVRGYNIRVVD